MIVTIDTDYLEPDAKGEILRSLVFDEKIDKWGYKETGCYDTFELADDFVRIDPYKFPALYKYVKSEDDEDVSSLSGSVYSYENENFVVMWQWDGDGTLIIWIKGESVAYYNGDCKCHYGWKEVNLFNVCI